MVGIGKKVLLSSKLHMYLNQNQYLGDFGCNSYLSNPKVILGDSKWENY